MASLAGQWGIGTRLCPYIKDGNRFHFRTDPISNLRNGDMRKWRISGTSPFGLKVRKCFVLGERLHYCQLPKMDVLDSVRLFRFET